MKALASTETAPWLGPWSWSWSWLGLGLGCGSGSGSGWLTSGAMTDASVKPYAAKLPSSPSSVAAKPHHQIGSRTYGSGTLRCWLTLCACLVRLRATETSRLPPTASTMPVVCRESKRAEKASRERKGTPEPIRHGRHASRALVRKLTCRTLAGRKFATYSGKAFRIFLPLFPSKMAEVLSGCPLSGARLASPRLTSRSPRHRLRISLDLQTMSSQAAEVLNAEQVVMDTPAAAAGASALAPAPAPVPVPVPDDLPLEPTYEAAPPAPAPCAHTRSQTTPPAPQPHPTPTPQVNRAPVGAARDTGHRA